jgi:IS30 family transposase
LTNIGASNGLIRQYLPKGTDLNKSSTEELDAIAEELNDRPRTVLADLTPNQAMRRLRHRIKPREIRNVR